MPIHQAPSQPQRQSSDRRAAQTQAATQRPAVPGLRAPAVLLQLQHSHGNRFVQGVLGNRNHTAPQRPIRAIIQPKRDKILTELAKVPFMLTKLQSRLPIPKNELDNHGNTVRKQRDETVRQRVEKILAQYKSALQKSHTPVVRRAIKLSFIIDGVAEAIAEELYDPILKPQIATTLMQLYQPEITQALEDSGIKQQPAGEVFALAQTLVSDDPLELFLHRELRIEDAAQRIHTMAQSAHMDAGAMFDLLMQRFESRVASYSFMDVSKISAKTGSYSTAETTGQISTDYFYQLFGQQIGNVKNKDKTPGWTKPSGSTTKELKFTPEMRQKLRDLRQAAVNVTATVPTVYPQTDPRLSQAQERHLREVQQADALEQMGDVRTQIASKLGLFGVPQEKAMAVVTRLENWLPTVPLTITVRGADWFGARVPNPANNETKFNPAAKRRNERSKQSIFGKGSDTEMLKYFGEYQEGHVAQDKRRGAHYLRFRTWKDKLMTGYMSEDDMPTFGAMNIGWEKGRSSGTPGDKDNFGVNYYGDTHFKLKPNEVRNRLVYTATDHGEPHRNPMLVLRDFLVGANDLSKSRTKIKSTSNYTAVANMIAMVMLNENIATETLPFEIQIFGAVDIAHDVERIYVAPAVSTAVKTNIDTFSQNTGVPYEELVKPPDNQLPVKMSSKELKPKLQTFDWNTV